MKSRSLVALLFLLVVILIHSQPSISQVSRHGVGCDPIPLLPREEPIPEGQGITCGDGRLAEYVALCAKYCGSTGCDRIIDCKTAPVTCTKAREICDGRNLGESTCKKLGFFGGQLKCDSSCKSFDVSTCQMCRADSTTKCYTAQLSKEMLDTSLSTSPAPTVTPTDKGVAISWQYRMMCLRVARRSRTGAIFFR